MLQSISWLQFGLFLLVVGGGYYFYVLMVFYRKEIWNYVSGRKSELKGKGEPTATTSAPGRDVRRESGAGAGKESGEGSVRMQDQGLGKRPGEGSGRVHNEGLGRRPNEGSGGMAGKSSGVGPGRRAAGLGPGRPVAGLGSSAVGNWPGVMSGSEDQMWWRPAEHRDKGGEEDDLTDGRDEQVEEGDLTGGRHEQVEEDDLTGRDLRVVSRWQGQGNNDSVGRIREDEQEEGSPGLWDGQGSQVEQKDELFRAMGKVVVLLKEVVRQAIENGTDRESLIDHLSDVLRKYGQLRGTPYQDGINNFLTRTCSTNFSLLVGADELEVMWS